jgi:hypothetical protein
MILFVFQNTNHLCAQTNIKWLIPINANNRQSFDEIKLTPIGQFGEIRKARPHIPSHLHTGIDILRPTANYDDEPVYSIGMGRVISLRDDDPFAQIIIEHLCDNGQLTWTVYEHVAGICVKLGQAVDPFIPIARFMNREELDKYGWQFDHLHIEILKIRPRPQIPDERNPFYYFSSYCLECFDARDLHEKYSDPFDFFK